MKIICNLLIAQGLLILIGPLFYSAISLNRHSEMKRNSLARIASPVQQMIDSGMVKEREIHNAEIFQEDQVWAFESLWGYLDDQIQTRTDIVYLCSLVGLALIGQALWLRRHIKRLTPEQGEVVNSE